MIQYPREYFEDEYRDGFLVERTMKCAWAAQLEVLRHISDICERHGLKYFAFFGTLLGAIRHHGFIPWDDDIDIAMLRCDYQKFLSVCKSELPKEYCVLNCYDYADWTEVNIRITNGDYIDTSEKRMSEYYGCPFSVGVDVYPLDTIPDAPEVFNQEKEILNLIATTYQRLGELETEEDAATQERLKTEAVNGLQMIGEILEYQFDFTGSLKSQLLQLFDQMCQVFSEEEGKMVTTMPTYIKGSTKIFHKSWLRENVDWPFEYSSIKIPIGFEACLWVRFGANYMVPKKIKSAHDYPFYKGQMEILRNRNLWERIERLSKRIVSEITVHEDSVKEHQNENRQLNYRKDRKKTLCYRVSIVEFLQHGEKAVEKMQRTLNMFEENKDKVNVFFFPDREILDTYENNEVVDKYERVLKAAVNMENVSIADTADYLGILNESDAFFGDLNHFTYYFNLYEKPVMIENIIL